MTDDAIATSAPARRRFSSRRRVGQIGLLVIVVGFWVVFSSLGAGLPLDLQPLHARPLARRRHRHRLLADGGARHRRHEPRRRLDRRLRRDGDAASCSRTSACRSRSPSLGALALGALLGWLNGFAIVKTGVNSFIITLASASLFLGAMLILTKAVPYNELPPAIGAFGTAQDRHLPVAAPPHRASLIGAALFVLYRYSTLGRQILAAGANPRAAAMSGVPVDRVIVISHALSGVARRLRRR